MSLGQMYEVVLFGDFAPDQDNFKSILNRFTLNTESCEKIHYREVLFEPVALAPPRNPPDAQNAVLLRCRQDILESAGTWYAGLSPRFRGCPAAGHNDRVFIRPGHCTRISRRSRFDNIPR